VQVAVTGQAGLEHVRIGSPDVIILDLGLPDQSGLEVYRQIHQINAHIPVIAVTRAGRAEGVLSSGSGNDRPQGGTVRHQEKE
jgi:DNA-binding response OmpR family regulator